jgi:hypothetical protein
LKSNLIVTLAIFARIIYSELYLLPIFTDLAILNTALTKCAVDESNWSVESTNCNRDREFRYD